MNEIEIKEISSYIENDTRRTRIVIKDSEKTSEIVLKGEGSLSVANPV